MNCKSCKADCVNRGLDYQLKQCKGYFAGTNADKVRAMTDEELAKFIPNWSYTNACKCGEVYFVDCNNECEGCVAEWLRQPAEGVEP